MRSRASLKNSKLCGGGEIKERNVRCSAANSHYVRTTCVAVRSRHIFNKSHVQTDRRCSPACLPEMVARNYAENIFLGTTSLRTLIVFGLKARLCIESAREIRNATPGLSAGTRIKK